LKNHLQKLLKLSGSMKIAVSKSFFRADDVFNMISDI